MLELVDVPVAVLLPLLVAVPKLELEWDALPVAVAVDEAVAVEVSEAVVVPEEHSREKGTRGRYAQGAVRGDAADCVRCPTPPPINQSPPTPGPASPIPNPPPLHPPQPPPHPSVWWETGRGDATWSGKQRAGIKEVKAPAHEPEAVLLWVPLLVEVPVAVPVEVNKAELLPVGVDVEVSDAVEVPVEVPVPVPDEVEVLVAVPEDDGVPAALPLDVPEAVAVDVPVAVWELVLEAVDVSV